MVPALSRRELRNGTHLFLRAFAVNQNVEPFCASSGHEEIPHAHQRRQPIQARLASPADGLVVAPIGTKDGSIIPTFITTRMPKDESAAPGHVCPGIRI